MSLLKVNTIRNRAGNGSPIFDYGINVTAGISTISGLKVQSGIVTSSSQSGIVTYYGDGIGITNIPNSGLQNSTISGKTLGSNLSNLTAGSYLTSGGTYNGSTARTFAVDATSSNTASKVVARDSNGDFSARYITATQFKKSGGTSSQFLKADGSVDSNSYLTVSDVGGGGGGSLSIIASNIYCSGNGNFVGIVTASSFETTSTNPVSQITSQKNISIISPKLGVGTTLPSSKLTVNGDTFISGIITATSIVSNGTVQSTGFTISGQSGFLKADGTVDTNTYLSSGSVNNGQLTIGVNGNGISVSSTPTFTANQSTNKTITLSLNSSSLNAGDSLVYRDVNGDFGANSITLDGDLSATNVISSSDLNLKSNVETINNSLDILSSINGVSFNWKQNNKKSFGVIAQEVEKVLPDVVSTINDKKAVNYNSLIAFLIEAVKELKSELEELKSK